MDIGANAPPVEIARWRSDELGEHPKAESEQDGNVGALGTSASKHSLFAAAGLDGGSGNAGVRSRTSGCFSACNTFTLLVLLHVSSSQDNCRDWPELTTNLCWTRREHHMSPPLRHQ